MNSDIIQKLRYSHEGHNESCPLPLPLKDSLQLISGFFTSNTTNKLCLVFPSKEYAAQWLTVPTVFSLIANDFAQFKGEIFQSYKDYRSGDKLILNDVAIVEWAGIKENGVAFKTKGVKGADGAEITIKFSDVIMLQKAPPGRKVLSALKTVKEALPTRSISATDKLLNIDTYGNKEFIKNKICLVSKYKSFDESTERTTINLATLPQYFQEGKIDEDGTVGFDSPLLLSNNLLNLTLYLTDSTVSKIIIDGFSAIQERITDFSAIDAKNIPTILITDLSEIDSFEHIGNYGFEFFNFTKENIKLDSPIGNSPFHRFDIKLRKYISFGFKKEICQNDEIESIATKIHSIERNESNDDLNSLTISLVQLKNYVSRLAHIPSPEEIINFKNKINDTETLYQRARKWIGYSHKPIDECIILLKSVMDKFTIAPSDKCAKLKSLLIQKRYDYLICPTEDDVKGLNNWLTSFSATNKPKVISIADANDELLSPLPVTAVLTGWAKSNSMNRILSSFLFSELTILLYPFENNYFNSLQRRNKRFNENIRATINSYGIRSGSEVANSKGYYDMYSESEVTETKPEHNFNVLDFELTLNNIQYSKYLAKGNLTESFKAKRIEFENEWFIYSTENHRFLVINELIEKKGAKATIHRRKVEGLKAGNIIALINTDRDILIELVEQKTNTKELAVVKQWTDLWKNLLKTYYESIGNDFKKLVADLKKNGCVKDAVTIRTWLQDEARIGPDDDADLINIAILTNSTHLGDNIKTVREAIKKMKGWRMEASDYIMDKIKTQIHEFADNTIINKRIPIEGLGSVNILKVYEVSNDWENVDAKFVNKLIKKELSV